MEDALDAFLNELRCSICLEDLNEALMLPCSHRFCRECVENVKNGACPLCKQAFVKRQMVRDLLVDRLVERAEVLRDAFAAYKEAEEERPVKRHRTDEEQRLDALRDEYNQRERQRLEGSEDGAPFEGPAVLLCTGLDEEMTALALELVRQRPGSKILEEWTPEVTHCLCGTDQTGQARRTLKYLCTVVSGGRVVSAASFLQRWRDSGDPPGNIFPHLVTGDGKSLGGPERALQSGGAPLLQGLTITLVEPLGTPKDTLIAVLEAAGAVRVRNSPDVVLCDECPYAVEELPHAASHWLHPTWLLDSAGGYRELDKDEYGAIVVPDDGDGVHDGQEVQKEKSQLVDDFEFSDPSE